MIKNICFKRLGLKKLEKFINFLYECYLMIVKFKEILIIVKTYYRIVKTYYWIVNLL